MCSSWGTGLGLLSGKERERRRREKRRKEGGEGKERGKERGEGTEREGKKRERRERDPLGFGWNKVEGVAVGGKREAGKKP